MTKSAKQFIQEITSLGGKARAAKLSPKQRKKIASDAAKARWAKVKKGKSSGD